MMNERATKFGWPYLEKDEDGGFPLHVCTADIEKTVRVLLTKLHTKVTVRLQLHLYLYPRETILGKGKYEYQLSLKLF